MDKIKKYLKKTLDVYSYYITPKPSTVSKIEQFDKWVSLPENVLKLFDNNPSGFLENLKKKDEEILKETSEGGYRISFLEIFLERILKWPKEFTSKLLKIINYNGRESGNMLTLLLEDPSSLSDKSKDRYLLKFIPLLERMGMNVKILLGNTRSTLLHYAIIIDDPDIFNLCIDKYPEMINKENLDSISPLMKAVHYKRESYIIPLLSKGANIYTVDRFGYNILMSVINNNYIDNKMGMIKLLLENVRSSEWGKIVDYINPLHGQTVLFYCRLFGYLDVEELLINRYGANKDIKDKKGGNKKEKTYLSMEI